MALLSTVSSSNWNLEMLVFEEGGKPEYWRKTLGAETRTNNKLNPHMTPSPRIEPGPHWWESSALTTASPLLLLRTRIAGPYSLCCFVAPLAIIMKSSISHFRWCKYHQTHCRNYWVEDVLKYTNDGRSWRDAELTTIETKTLYRAFSLDVKAAILVYQNNETAAILVYQTNPVGVGLWLLAT